MLDGAGVGVDSEGAALGLDEYDGVLSAGAGARLVMVEPTAAGAAYVVAALAPQQAGAAGAAAYVE